ncbi:protein FAM110A [Microcaecilia unicolor]|uniref:Protein FAM110A n=1 Tax=Microcaecilia unicolor TaxID=1415580 RepID=A0A6P7YX55_9AMPH|nr:protein FAM110A [Microcaecilia unicolor]XP_030068005.1 protein FAM110A [Microcaecilia unicolor]XP_030068006.1 protein FAM110A [Microcaecilia unicolor]XP_030068007.1 protein FAM110A [Microcaecilia unicolor]XP_030068008.1 protein FAM110A [Microcaecilia unicolor]XP_030068010.1 protein FAM110A [Microcaecilia unicolor]XP_030068011.1 protein FAM110A [Microcaecilia unicolor]XP_030068012.1 protein FAM110A [Microcaecilia unicolor]XP_030068013.1 protein FAM110A [Microcaecilia unicolor]
MLVVWLCGWSQFCIERLGVLFMMPIEAAQKSNFVSNSSVRPLPFLRLAEHGTRKPSAVERLEADKAKYVKSKWVMSTRQEPVKPQHRPLFSSVVQRGLLPSSKSMKDEAPRTSLNLQILHNLINLTPVQTEHCNTLLAPDSATQERQGTPDFDFLDSPLPLVTFKCERLLPLDSSTQGKWGVLDPSSCEMPLLPARSPCKQPSSMTAGRASGLVAIRRVDVRPSVASRPRLCPTVMVTPVNSDLSTCGFPKKPSSDGQMASSVKQPWMSQSKSDLSDCFSRATADLERFFNYCGLAPEEINPEHLTRASSDIVSGTYQSSALTDNAGGSDCAHSQHSRYSQQHQAPCSVSIIERNARVIKWLYELKQAQKAQRQQTLPRVQ